MSDTRFWTVCANVDELMDTVDVDEIGDIETLLMFFFARPVSVDHVWDEDVEVADLEFGAIEVTIPGKVQQVVSLQRFPMDVVQLVRWCAETVASLGPPVGEDTAPVGESPDVLTLSDDDLTTALQEALGKVRLFKMMYPDEEA